MATLAQRRMAGAANKERSRITNRVNTRKGYESRTARQSVNQQIPLQQMRGDQAMARQRLSGDQSQADIGLRSRGETQRQLAGFDNEAMRAERGRGYEAEDRGFAREKYQEELYDKREDTALKAGKDFYAKTGDATAASKLAAGGYGGTDFNQLPDRDMSSGANFQYTAGPEGEPGTMWNKKTGQIRDQNRGAAVRQKLLELNAQDPGEAQRFVDALRITEPEIYEELYGQEMQQ